MKIFIGINFFKELHLKNNIRLVIEITPECKKKSSIGSAAVKSIGGYLIDIIFCN